MGGGLPVGQCRVCKAPVCQFCIETERLVSLQGGSPFLPAYLVRDKSAPRWWRLVWTVSTDDLNRHICSTCWPALSALRKRPHPEEKTPPRRSKRVKERELKKGL